MRCSLRRDGQYESFIARYAHASRHLTLNLTILKAARGRGRARNSDGIVCLNWIPLKKYIPSNSQETSLQIYTHIFSLKIKMVEILTDLNWK